MNSNGNGQSNGVQKEGIQAVSLDSREDRIKFVKGSYRILDGIMKNDVWKAQIPEEEYDQAWVIYYQAISEAYAHNFVRAEELIQQAIVKTNEVVFDAVMRTLKSNQGKMLETKYMEFFRQLEEVLFPILVGEDRSLNKISFGDPIAEVFHGIFKAVKEYERIAEELKKKRMELDCRLGILNERISKWSEGSSADMLSQMFQMVKGGVKNAPGSLKEDEAQIEGLEKTLATFEQLRKTQQQEKEALEAKSVEMAS